ncbi:MAG: minC [Firmicutes bacterium]|nr:minC [Bacillota bacterium]
MRQEIMFKGVRGNLQLIFSDNIDFSEVLHQIRTKLVVAADFFGVGNMIQVPMAKQRLTQEEQAQLTAVFSEYGLLWESVDGAAQAPVPEQLTIQADQAEDDVGAPQTLIIEKTLRGGQKVVSDYSVVVFGDVNPGAEIIAGGDIIVLGACRGMAHAGAHGNRRATIKADRLLASQLRIADVISRSPDQLNDPEHPEIARIVDGIVMIEPAEQPLEN